MGLKFPADILICYFCLSPFYINHLNQKKHIFLRLTEPSALSQEAKLAEFPKTSIPALRLLLTFPEKVLIFSKLFFKSTLENISLTTSAPVPASNTSPYFIERA